MKLYPVFLKLAELPVLVVGGGVVAERKVRGLLEAGAALTVLSPRLSAGLEELHREGCFDWRARPYREGDLAGFTLVIGATSDTEANRLVHEEGRRRGVLVNSVDDPGNCDFFVPAVARRGPLALAVSTSGAAPYLARRLREALERRLYPGIEADLERLERLRRAERGVHGGRTERLEPLAAEILARMGLS